jgi:hypothetical protein
VAFLRARYRRIFSAAVMALPVLGRPRPRLGGLLVTVTVGCRAAQALA